MNKSTDELTNELISADSMSDWQEKAADSIQELSLAEYLARMLHTHKIAKKNAIANADIDPIYGYQIFQGKKMPSRDNLLRIAFGLGLSFDETKRLLYYGNAGTLYPRVRRDAYLIYALHNRYTVTEANHLLYENSERTL